MKVLSKLLIFFSCGLMIAQIGIGTTNPQADLHVAGDMLVQDNFTIKTLGTVSAAEEDFKLLTRTTNTIPEGEIRELDVDQINVAPINTVNYTFTNISLDNLTDVDLQYDTTKYIVAVANFRYVGDAIKKINSGSSKSIGQFVVRTYEDGGTWHLEIRNRSLDLLPAETVDYYVTLIVYDKSYFRNLTPITTDLGGSNSGSASSIPVIN